MSPPPGWSCAMTTNDLDVVSHKRAQGPCTRPWWQNLATHVLGCCPMDNRVARFQNPAGATPLLRFGLPSPPGVVGVVMAPGSASRKHPFYVVCKCGPGCCACGGCRVGVGAWGHGPLVVLHVRALFVGGGGCVWVKCPCGGSGPHPRCWVLGWCWCSRRVMWLSAAVVVVHYFALLRCTVCCAQSCAGDVMPPVRCALCCLREAWRQRLPGQGCSPRWG